MSWELDIEKLYTYIPVLCITLNEFFYDPRNLPNIRYIGSQTQPNSLSFEKRTYFSFVIGHVVWAKWNFYVFLWFIPPFNKKKVRKKWQNTYGQRKVTPTCPGILQFSRYIFRITGLQNVKTSVINHDTIERCLYLIFVGLASLNVFAKTTAGLRNTKRPAHWHLPIFGVRRLFQRESEI